MEFRENVRSKLLKECYNRFFSIGVPLYWISHADYSFEL
jgi:hypothetical protein